MHDAIRLQNWECRVILRTLNPLGIHLDNFVHQLNREPAFSLRLADLLRVPALGVNEVQHVQSHVVIFELQRLLIAERSPCEVVGKKIVREMQAR